MCNLSWYVYQMFSGCIHVINWLYRNVNNNITNLKEYSKVNRYNYSRGVKLHLSPRLDLDCRTPCWLDMDAVQGKQWAKVQHWWGSQRDDQKQQGKHWWQGLPQPLFSPHHWHTVIRAPCPQFCWQASPPLAPPLNSWSFYQCMCQLTWSSPQAICCTPLNYRISTQECNEMCLEVCWGIVPYILKQLDLLLSLKIKQLCLRCQNRCIISSDHVKYFIRSFIKQ